LKTLLLLSLISVWFGLLKLPTQPRGDFVTTATFNIRTATIIDLWNHWGFRKTKVTKTIKSLDADILAIQECNSSQSKFIIEQMKGYAAVITPRSKGGESSVILYKKDLFEKLESGKFWLSETPDVVGSKSWGTNYPRVVSWVKLRNNDGIEFFVFAVHLDTNRRAREKSADVLHRHIRKISEGYPAIILGDFNDQPESTTHRTMLQTLFDTLTGNQHTRPGFTGLGKSGRIDWILLTPDIKLISSEVINGRGSSDHNPVVAIIYLPESGT
jgi:endonuclease/exonuclease/phosphatase family metal-dependent hydrolase